jgi:molecular chaperone GrpE
MTHPQSGDPRGQRPAAGQGPPAPPPPAGEAPAQDTSGTGPVGPEGNRADEAQVEHDLEALLSERDEYLDLAKRTKADFENYRKRMSSEVQAAGARGKAELIREVLPALDDLERAIQAAGLDPEGDSPDGLAHGVLLVFRSLLEALARNGVEAVDPHGEMFDPNLHEALSKQPADGADPGTVIEVMQKGYRLGEQLVRPARVVVAE